LELKRNGEVVDSVDFQSSDDFTKIGTLLVKAKNSKGKRNNIYADSSKSPHDSANSSVYAGTAGGSVCEIFY
jgi:hypothetical protein